jgi:hypothetical protein
VDIVPTSITLYERKEINMEIQVKGMDFSDQK